MIITPHDARKHDCPFMKDGCSADDCMMWRWHEDKTCEKTPAEIAVSFGTPAENVRPHPRRGFCGLAGRPQFG